MPHLEQPAMFNPFADSAHRDPYPYYAAMRAEQPVCHQPELDFWFVSRYGDVSTLVNDWETFTLEYGEDIDDTASLAGHDGNLLENDPPRHRTLRRVVQTHWTPASLAARLSNVTETEIAKMVRDVQNADGDRMDFGLSTTTRLPVSVITEFMGLGAEDRAELMRLQMELMEREPGATKPPPSAIAAAAGQAKYFAAQLESRQHRPPTDDLLSVIVEAERAGTIRPAESVGLAHQMFAAAIDTTGSLLANMFMLLGGDLEQQRLLRADPGLVDGAIEEVLRFESPIQNAKRVARCDATLAGISIPEGATVVPLFGSANRDDRRFQDADVFNVRREPQRNLAFGAGVHHCLGAPLAQLEARKLLATFIRDLPPFHLAGEPQRYRHSVVRTLASVPLIFGEHA